MKKLMISVALLTALAFGANAQEYKADGQVFYEEDKAPAIRIYNSGSETVKINIDSGGASATNHILIGSTRNTIDGSGAAVDTVAEFAAAIEACTNSAGKKVLTVDTGCAVATTESTDGELLDADENAAANQIAPGSWGQVYWDTSDVKHFRTYLPASDKGAKRGGAVVKSVYGAPGGTGDITITGYLNGDVVFENVLAGASYVTSDGTTYITNANVNVNIPLDIYVGAADRFLISADRATTGTTGGAGITLKYK